MNGDKTAVEYIAGIDGGGTGTKLECRDGQNRVLCRRTFGPYNLNSIGEARFSALLAEITDALSKIGTCTALCIGAAGISNPGTRELTAAAMKRAGIRRWRLVGDHEIALHGALSGKAGCILIAGTGSVCCGRNEAGEFVRVGGWGHLIDDGGSGYALGRDAAAAVVRQWDGRGETTLLTDLIMEKLAVRTPQELTAYLYSGDKRRLAGLAPLVTQAASDGDSIALEIEARNGAELGRLACAAAARLGMAGCEVALLGGVLEHDCHLKAALIRYLEEHAPGLCCAAPRADALTGAVMMAAELTADG